MELTEGLNPQQRKQFIRKGVLVLAVPVQVKHV